ncbi:MAG TPA: phosphotyrosine protein phosphatase [Bacteroidetes bacterium]|nr:phosphotyrosine protein phosphatase [Bacteroidota bacterium]HIL58611.1 phosphotyrosine protein phosphatase [Rhodothermales bacterium]
MPRVLFVCSRNRRRSPTAERLYQNTPGVEALSAGTAPDAEVRVSLDLIEWADLIVCMEPRHARALQRDFGPHLADARILTLHIPDDYEPDDPALVHLLRQRLAGRLGGV